MIPLANHLQTMIGKLWLIVNQIANQILHLFLRHAHYQTGNTPLVLVWKDENCSQYVMDTDSKGQIPSQQQVVLELQNDGKLATSDDPPVEFGCLDGDFIQKTGLQQGNLLRFAVGDAGLSFVDGKLGRADLNYLGKPNRARTFADSYSKDDEDCSPHSDKKADSPQGSTRRGLPLRDHGLPTLSSLTTLTSRIS